MCWNQEVSWITFFVGTALNIFLVTQIREPIIWGLAIFWQWILFMQVIEAFYWRNYQSQNLEKQLYWTRLADWNSILQPIVLLGLLIASSSVSNHNKIIASIIGVLYLIIIFQTVFSENNISGNPGNPGRNLRPEGCSHLNISWWEYSLSIYIYPIALFLIFILLLRPIKFMMIIVGYVFLGLIISLSFYKCGTASMWCWFTAFAPIVTYFAWKITH